MRCSLQKNINTCPYYKPDEELCTNESSGCSYRYSDDKEILPKNYKYVREPRWYEKYLK
jgi:hypothetical protein